MTWERRTSDRWYGVEYGWEAGLVAAVALGALALAGKSAGFLTEPIDLAAAALLPVAMAAAAWGLGRRARGARCGWMSPGARRTLVAAVLLVWLGVGGLWLRGAIRPPEPVAAGAAAPARAPSIVGRLGRLIASAAQRGIGAPTAIAKAVTEKIETLRRGDRGPSAGQRSSVVAPSAAPEPPGDPPHRPRSSGPEVGRGPADPLVPGTAEGPRPRRARKPRSEPYEPASALAVPPGQHPPSDAEAGKSGSSGCWGLNSTVCDILKAIIWSPFHITRHVVSIFEHEGQRIAVDSVTGEAAASAIGRSMGTGGTLDAGAMVERFRASAQADRRVQVGPGLLVMRRVVTDPRAAGGDGIDPGQAAGARAVLDRALADHWRERAAFIDALRGLRALAEQVIDCPASGARLRDQYRLYFSRITSVPFARFGIGISEARLQSLLRTHEPFAQFVFVAVADRRGCVALAGAGLGTMRDMPGRAPHAFDTYSQWMRR